MHTDITLYNYHVFYVEPTYTALIEYLEGIRSWKTVAAHLLSDEDGKKIEIIARNNHHIIQDCRAEMLREFFKIGKVSWEAVLEALMKADEMSTVDKIKQML